MLDSLGYIVRYQVLNTLDYGLPQMRERIYIVGIKNNLYTHPFEFPPKIKNNKIQDFLLGDGEDFDISNPTFQKYLNNPYNKDKINLKEILEKDFNIIDTRQSDCRIYAQKVPTLRTGRLSKRIGTKNQNPKKFRKQNPLTSRKCNECASH